MAESPSPSRLKLWDAALLSVATLLLMAPALWNGYPLFFYDSVDYIASSFSFQPAIYRTLPYSLFVRLSHAGISLWGTVLFQALIIAYLLLEAALAFAPRAPRRAFAAALAVVVLGSGLPWFASQLMPDLFTGPMVLGLALLALAPLPAPRRVLVWLITIIAISTHASHLGTAIVLAFALLPLPWLIHRAYPVKRLIPVSAVAAALLVTPVSHRIATGELYLSRSAPIMALARLIRDGEAQRYLAEVCPQAGYKLCDHVAELETGWDAANIFLWVHGSPFEKIGGWPAWREVGTEARQIIRGTLLTHPLDNLVAALHTWGEQLVTFGTGSGVGAAIWQETRLKDTVQELFPLDGNAVGEARQYRTDLDLSGLSRVHQTVLAIFMLAGLALLLRHRRLESPTAAFLLLVVLAALVNSGVTAIFSNPDDRYQARLVWLFIPALIYLLASGRKRTASGA